MTNVLIGAAYGVAGWALGWAAIEVGRWLFKRRRRTL